MGRRSGFSVNLLLAKKEERVAAEAEGKPALENFRQLLILELAGAMEDGSEDALKKENPAGRNLLNFPDSSQGLRCGLLSTTKGVGSGGSSPAGQGGLAGKTRSSCTLEFVSSTPASCQGPQG